MRNDKLVDKLYHASFTERDRRLIENCRVYASHDPAGLPGHNLMLIVARLDSLLTGFLETLSPTEATRFWSRFEQPDQS